MTQHGEYDLILSIFTQEFGVIRAFAKGARRPSKRDWSLFCRPGSFAEWELQQGRADLWRLVDGALLFYPSGVYSSWEALHGSLQMFQALVKTQWSHKPAAQLFTLTMAFLIQMDRNFHPNLLITYLCKVLQHEGSFPPECTCQVCGEHNCEKLYCCAQGFICSKHPRPDQAIAVVPELLAQLERLVACHSFNEIRAAEVHPDSQQFVEMLLSNLSE